MNAETTRRAKQELVNVTILAQMMPVAKAPFVKLETTELSAAVQMDGQEIQVLARSVSNVGLI